MQKSQALTLPTAPHMVRLQLINILRHSFSLVWDNRYLSVKRRMQQKRQATGVLAAITPLSTLIPQRWSIIISNRNSK